MPPASAVTAQDQMPDRRNPSGVSRTGSVADAGSIGTVGEFGFLARLLPRLPSGRGVLVGPGDDCAVVEGTKRMLLTTDALVEGVHFRSGWMTARQLGRKAYLVNASDIAAMGGEPRFSVASMAVPSELSTHSLSEIHRGIVEAAGQSGAVLVGGNITRSRQLMISITLVGNAPRHPVRRSGARPGDQLFVTGSLGEAALGLRLLERDASHRGRFVARFREPRPRLRAGATLARARAVSAMIDISDGLLQDLGHVCEASGVGARIEIESVPMPSPVRREGGMMALAGGEDYELLAAVPVQRARSLRRLLPQLGCAFTWIGEVMPKRYGIRVIDRNGREVSMRGRGFDHFSGSGQA